ncbi:MAG: KUP/HAK/KT family potassium transporter [Atopobiaceae bacterium]|nr:KUP/HAK/KT family potassium transporter [Atopobiaceae bacterium]
MSVSGTSVPLPKKAEERKSSEIPLSAAMLLVTLGVVYGDIGTSPMYVMKSIVAGNGGITTVSEEMILGALSLVIWTITLVTTVKYVLIAMKADNRGEGGIFALYSLVKRYRRWLIIPAMIGGAALLADGILTPAVTVTTAIEGLRTLDIGYRLVGPGQARVVAITIAIICVLFFMQKAGTSSIGKLFGPVMTLWFLFLGGMGLVNFIGNPGILRALDPIRGITFLFSPTNKAGMRILGFVFLCTTGAEALYSDMGHVGKANVYASWPFVKLCLIFNYLGQGAWCLANVDNQEVAFIANLNPFFQMLPEGMRPFAILLSTLAAIIASQALITGSFTLVSEATRLDLMPHMQVSYPSETKGQLYIPLVNNIMWVGTVLIVLFFRTSERMEAAYGLAITVTMLMTTTLLVSYLAGVRKKPAFAVLFALVFGTIELAFFISCCTMFLDGGYVMIILSAALFYVIYVWRRGTAIERAQSVYLPVKEYINQLAAMRDDTTHHVRADNLVFLTNDSSPDRLDRDILYSILDKRPKRARAYWFINVKVTDEPYTHSYVVTNFGTNFIFKVQLQLGFKVNQRVNTYLRQIVADLVEGGEIAPQHHHYSIYKNPGITGDFRFCMIRKVLTPDTDVSSSDYRTMNAKYAIRGWCGSPSRWYGLENSSIIFEYVPLFKKAKPATKLERIPYDHRSFDANETATLPIIVEEDEDIFSEDTISEREESEKAAVSELIGGSTARFQALGKDEE